MFFQGFKLLGCKGTLRIISQSLKYLKYEISVMVKIDRITQFVIAIALASLFYPIMDGVVKDVSQWPHYVVVYVICLCMAAIVIGVIMRDQNDNDGKGESIESSVMVEGQSNQMESVTDFIYWANIPIWLMASIGFIIISIMAFTNPQFFDKKNIIGLTFLGIAFSSVVMFLYFADKINNRKADKNRDKQLEDIKNMVQKWDFK